MPKRKMIKFFSKKNTKQPVNFGFFQASQKRALFKKKHETIYISYLFTIHLSYLKFLFQI